jgi:hypothetical protein
MPNDFQTRSRAFHQERLQALRDNPRLLAAVQMERDEDGAVVGVGLNQPDEPSVFERLARAEAEQTGAPVPPRDPTAAPKGARRPGSHPVYEDDEEPIPVEEGHHVSLLTRARRPQSLREKEALSVETPTAARAPVEESKSEQANPAHPRRNVPNPVRPQARRPSGGS